MMVNTRRKYITGMLKQHEEFIVIGLTGRIGSGCSETANVFGSTFEELNLPPIYPGSKGMDSDDERDKRILYRYASHHWLKFDVIKVRTIITLFMLKNFDQICKVDLFPLICQENNKKEKNRIIDIICEKTEDFINIKELSDLKLEEDVEALKKCIVSKGVSEQEFDEWAEVWRDIEGNFEKEIINYVFETDETIQSNIETVNIDKMALFFKNIYAIADDANNYEIRKVILKQVDDLLARLSQYSAKKWWDKNIKNKNYEDKNKIFQSIGKYLYDWKQADRINFFSYMLVHDILPALGDAIHDLLTLQKGSLFTELFQKYGNSIRAYGEIGFEKNIEIDGKIENTFSISRGINHFIKIIRHPFSRSFAKPTRIVIDSIKNVFEATYLRERYSAFYLFAISANEEVRVNRLMNRDRNLTHVEINYMDWNEYSNQGAEKYEIFLKENIEKKKAYVIYEKLEKKLTETELGFIKKVNSDELYEKKQVWDPVRKAAYTKKIYQFILQDVGASIQNADVFISNNHTQETINKELQWEIVRNVSLIMYPGLLMPTPIERCMQEAFTAKANSGCLSRQVGAVVTDSEYNILSIGWNDVPYCDISCARKNFIDIHKQDDLQAYTDYEINNKEFQARIDSIYKSTAGNLGNMSIGEILCGIPWRYCFKDVHQSIKQPMRSRAMHAEEKALSNVQNNAVGGCLFTTSSPCEMCSKNAKNHQIKKIYYIEPYPGISEEQYSESGAASNRAEHILFTGAIGRAYTQMYLPIMPHKDVLEFLGISVNDRLDKTIK